jgi:hypothetical protein
MSLAAFGSLHGVAALQLRPSKSPSFRNVTAPLVIPNRSEAERKDLQLLRSSRS